MDSIAKRKNLSLPLGSFMVYRQNGTYQYAMHFGDSRMLLTPHAIPDKANIYSVVWKDNTWSPRKISKFDKKKAISDWTEFGGEADEPRYLYREGMTLDEANEVARKNYVCSVCEKPFTIHNEWGSFCEDRHGEAEAKKAQKKIWAQLTKMGIM